MTVTIENWNANDQLDARNTGYNDYVLTSDAQGLLPEDDANGILSNTTTTFATQQQVDQELARINGGTAGVIQSSDHIYRMVRDGRTFFVLRRSRVSDECRVSVRPQNQHNFSENMAQALAFIGGFGNQGDPSGEMWCRRPNGTSVDPLESPWNLSHEPNQPGLGYLRATLSMITEIRAGRMPSAIPSGDQARARTLANAVDANELSTLISWTDSEIAIQRAPNEIALSDSHTVRAAVIFTLVAGGIAFLWHGWSGGSGPGGGGGGGGNFWKRLFLTGIKGVISGAFAGSPKTTPTTTPTPAPEGVTQSVNAAESSNTSLYLWAGGLFAVGVLGTIGLRGRAEVRADEVRTDEVRTDEMRARNPLEAFRALFSVGDMQTLQPATAGGVRTHGFLGAH